MGASINFHPLTDKITATINESTDFQWLEIAEGENISVVIFSKADQRERMEKIAALLNEVFQSAPPLVAEPAEPEPADAFDIPF